MKYFDEKIERIYSSFDELNRRSYSLLPDFPFNSLKKFKPIDFSDLQNVVKNAKKTYCNNDPYPMIDIEEASNFKEVMKLYHKIVNMSLTQPMFPKSEKFAYVKPTIKGKADHQCLNSYRPISNLSFLSKIIESVVHRQLMDHLERIKVLPENQSAYRKGHSTESALCSVMNDLLKIIDGGKCGILILLDLSAAFDTVVR